LQKTEASWSAYSWIVAIAAGIVMTTSFVPFVPFGILSSVIAASMKTSPALVQQLGVDNFNIGLFAAFFLGHGAVFDKGRRGAGPSFPHNPTVPHTVCDIPVGTRCVEVYVRAHDNDVGAYLRAAFTLV